MLGDFITRGLLLILGYAYPAFECFKTMEKNRVEMAELRFWCQYWIIVAMLTVVERIGDIFVSWLPMYGEMKLALIIYLWYPKTKGSGFVYETLLRPYVAQHETDIERNLQMLRARAWDLAIYYWQNCTEIGQTTFFEIFQYLATQTSRIRNITSSERTGNHDYGAPPPPPSTSAPPLLHRPPPNNQRQQWNRRRQPPPPTTATNRSVAQSLKSNTVQVDLHNHTEYIHFEDQTAPEWVSGPSSTDESDTGLEQNLRELRLRHRRSKGFH